MRFEEAKRTLKKWCQNLDGKPPSTNKSARRSPNGEAGRKQWWLENSGTSPDWRSPRSVAYLVAYVEIAGSVFPAAGIAVEEGFIWPDRAVMRSLILARCVAFVKGNFRLTDKGEALIAPMVILSDGMARKAAR